MNPATSAAAAVSSAESSSGGEGAREVLLAKRFKSIDGGSATRGRRALGELLLHLLYKRKISLSVTLKI